MSACAVSMSNSTAPWKSFGKGRNLLCSGKTQRWRVAAIMCSTVRLQSSGESTFGWDKGRAVCPALPNMLGLRHWMAEQNIAEPQKPHAIQVEVYLQRKSIVCGILRQSAAAAR